MKVLQRSLLPQQLAEELGVSVDDPRLRAVLDVYAAAVTAGFFHICAGDRLAVAISALLPPSVMQVQTGHWGDTDPEPDAAADPAPAHERAPQSEERRTDDPLPDQAAFREAIERVDPHADIRALLGVRGYTLTVLPSNRLRVVDTDRTRIICEGTPDLVREFASGVGRRILMLSEYQ